jgi:Zn-dependent protease
MSTYVYFFIAIVPSIVLHEVSHGYVALFFGDPTAKEQGRLTLNPLRHIDLFGTILLPALLLFSGLPAIGYAKPVPVNFSRLRNPRRQTLYVALAGPIVNLLLVLFAYLLCEFARHVLVSGSVAQGVLEAGAYLGLVNLMLAGFNLLPIPPLDGSAIIERFIPQRQLPSYYRFRQYALPLVFVLVILDSLYFHLGNTVLLHLENWWLGRIS